MNIFRKIQYSQNWNIGFCEQTPEELIEGKELRPIKWMKHPYRSIWFADPFILKVTEEEIVVFVEECPIENPKGIICELVIERKSMRLKERYVLLDLDTHLSYPAIIRHEGKVYVYPENGASGKLNLYEYEPESHRLINPICILNESVADATILEYKGHFLMSATKFPDTQSKAYLYESDSLFKPFRPAKETAYQTGTHCSRQGGNWFSVYEEFYRPAQNCKVRYGGSLSIMKSYVSKDMQEHLFCQLLPKSKHYRLGLHTINFCDDICVIDGCGYLLPFWGRLYYSVKKLLKL